MLIKKKQLFLIFFSSAVVTVVMLSTLIGYGLYIHWKEDSYASSYQNSIYKLTGDIFRKDIDIYGVNISSTDMRGRPVVEGKIKNYTSKTISSVMLELTFSRSDGSVLYRDWFHPLGSGMLPGSPFFSSIRRYNISLSPGESMVFKHSLLSCPAEVLAQFFEKGKFAKTENDKKILLELKVVGASLI